MLSMVSDHILLVGHMRCLAAVVDTFNQERADVIKNRQNPKIDLWTVTLVIWENLEIKIY